MAANHKTAHFDNVRERRAERLAGVEPGDAVAPVDDNEAEAQAEAEYFDNSVELTEAEDEARAQASEASDSAGAESEAENLDTQGKEKPLTFGGIDG